MGFSKDKRGRGMKGKNGEGQKEEKQRNRLEVIVRKNERPEKKKTLREIENGEGKNKWKKR